MKLLIFNKSLTKKLFEKCPLQSANINKCSPLGGRFSFGRVAGGIAICEMNGRFVQRLAGKLAKADKRKMRGRDSAEHLFWFDAPVWDHRSGPSRARR